MHVYIRHADKAYDNGKATQWKHDPPITSEGSIKARCIAQKLVELHGPPSLIITSPYRRARQTAHEMNSILGQPVPIFCDNLLSEYLGNHRGKQLDVTAETLQHQPPHPETYSQFRHRIGRFLTLNQYYLRVLFKVQLSPNQPIWLITHGVVLKEVGRAHNIKVIKHPPTLSYVTISKSTAQVSYS